MDQDEAAWRVAAARDEMQKLAQRGEASTLEALRSYVQSRETTYEAFRRIDPNAEHTQEALELLEKARRDLAAFSDRFGNASSGPDQS